MANKNFTERTKPAGMTDAAWMTLLRTKTAAELAQYDVTRSVKCCDDDCSDHDADAVTVRTLRAKSLASTLTPAEVASHNLAEIRMKAKGLL